ncbi:hypothetical protein QYF36_010039 [Acer negundo]|nr:hypothetical protein QYF36_010039 [Acer negundo]
MASKEGNEDHNVLMVVFSSQGHINPFLRLGKCLVSKEFHAILATTKIAQHRMLNGGNSVSNKRLVFFSDGFDMDYDRKANVDHYLETFYKVGPVLANSLLELEKEAIDSMSELCPIRPVGPLVPPSLLS